MHTVKTTKTVTLCIDEKRCLMNGEEMCDSVIYVEIVILCIFDENSEKTVRKVFSMLLECILWYRFSRN